MSVLLPAGTAEQQLAERYPTPFLTFIYTLKRQASIPPDLFYGYWRDAHCQISARLPGQHSLWIHFLDFERGRLWPLIPGIERDLAPADRFDGVPEPVFLTEADVGHFAEAMAPLVDDEGNVFEETIGYRALGANSRTFIDRLADPAPDLDESVLRFLVFCKQSEAVGSDDFRAFMRDRLASTWACSPEVLKLRLHLLEPYINENLLMDSSDVSHFKAPEKQYQACFEIVFADALRMREFAASPAWQADEQRAHMREQHAFHVVRRYSMRYGGEMTLTGRRTSAVAEQIRRIGAVSQTQPHVLALLGDTIRLR